MPPALHPYLKRGLDFKASPTDPSDLVEDIAVGSRDEEFNAAKRRRVEAIALQCLRGKPPLILTARLKGPFTKDWRNPWREDAQTKPGEQSKGVAVRAERQGRGQPKRSYVPSPETSRAAGHSQEALDSAPDLEPLPATAPLPDEDDSPGTTEFFSIDNEQFIANNSPANPFWLRRPGASIRLPPNSQTDKSPTRPRTKDPRFNSRKSLQLAPPKEPLGGRPFPFRATPPDEWRSSASASMDVSSSHKPATIVEHAPGPDVMDSTSSTDIPDSSRLRADSAQEEEARSSQAAQFAQASLTAATPSSLPNVSKTVSSGALAHAQSFDSLVPATTYKVSSTVQVPQSSPSLSRAELQKSAERLANMMPRLAKKQPQSPATHKPAKSLGLPNNLRHDLVASPAPTSSTGFMYRRVGQPKGENENIAKARPRAVSFSSPPARNKRGAAEADVESGKQAPTVEAGVVDSMQVVEAVGGSSDKEDNDGTVLKPEEDQSTDKRQESYRSKQSQYSTQAAMLLAQLEFQQDSSQSSTSSTTLRPWSQPALNTPPPLLPQPSPAITPLSVFNARTDRSFIDLAGDSVSHGPSISTQDLFEAASPFAFSTVKKKSQHLQRSSLRFALASRLGESTTAKSPSPSAERVPLKEKNTPTMWSFTDDKSLCASKLTSQSPKRNSNNNELPLLDFHTSLDFGPSADFTDCFLRGLDGEP
ncbi:hypothetical protein SVAN01_07627 [Stagonosporopsis vannaccii]|nr:hypothetical protein SVAN01_07627 [Stagonosporopsis vannaccii]